MKLHMMLPSVSTAETNETAILDYAAALLTAPQLREMEVPKRPALLGKWMCEGDIGFVFAPRGVGKTWVAMLIGNAIAEGVKLGEWEAGERPRRVLYVDGEMSLADSQERALAVAITSQNFVWLHHEQLFETQDQTLNIGSAPCQQAISALLESGSVLILDNLSALCRGVAENDNDSWEALLSWLLSLRRRKVTVIIVHHAGRNGEMRGASRREDAANWILRLQDDTGDDEKREKAIVSSFTKCRGCSPQDAASLRWMLKLDGGALSYTCKPHAGPDALLALVLDGVDTANDCAEMLGVSKGAVSKWAKKLHGDGRIRIERRKYLPLENKAEATKDE
jgi:putative DNA primase/helicase